MKLLIEIPEKTYHMINAGFYDYGDMNLIIQHGIPLPKGHGRLIDADDIDNHIVGSVDTRDCPTIIEADKAESEDKERRNGSYK